MVSRIQSIVRLCALALLLPSVLFAAKQMISLPLPTDTVTMRCEQGTVRFSVGPGLLSGEPGLPATMVRLVVPADADPSSISVSVYKPQFVELHNKCEVLPTPPLAVRQNEPIWPPNKNIADGYDTDIYGSNALFPHQWHGTPRIAAMGPHRIVEVAIYPYRYNPHTRQLVRLSSGTLQVHYSTTLQAAPLSLRSSSDRFARRLQGMVANPELLGEPLKRVSLGTAATTAPEVGYAILTTAAIAQSSTKLNAFISAKQAQGYTVHLLTEAQWGGGRGDVAAENIRAWMQAHYLSMNLQYLLLIGNPHPTSGDVPMKMCMYSSGVPDYPDAPTDYYYGELSGDWDSDNDGFYGEDGDDFGKPGGPDLYAEVSVGRIPYYGTMADLDAILDKTIRYGTESDSDSRRRRSLILPMEPLDAGTPMFQLGEQIKDELLVPHGFSFHRVYDRYNAYLQNQLIEGIDSLVPPPETIGCNLDNVLAAWLAAPRGMAVWATHGWEHGASDVMDLDHAAQLNNAHPAFTFQASCTNARPEDAQNLCYALLRNGGIGTIGGTRVTWYYLGETDFRASGSNGGLSFQYAAGQIRDRLSAGEALDNARSNVGGSIWMNSVDIVLYGDPSLGIYATKQGLSSDSAVALTDAPYGRVSSTTVPLFNSSARAITITRAQLANENFSITETLPLTVAPGERAALTIAYNCQSIGTATTTLLLTTADYPLEPITLTLSVKGYIPAHLEIARDTVRLNLAPGDTASFSLPISNSGGVDLDYTLQLPQQPLSGPAQGGPDLFGYRWSSSARADGPTYRWDDISASGTLLTTLSQEDDYSEEIVLPFPMYFYGSFYQTLHLSSNGSINFSYPHSVAIDDVLPSDYLPPRFIAGLNTDLNPGQGGSVYMQADAERVVFQFDDVRHYYADGTASFQMVLEASGRILFYYKQVSFPTNAAEVGIQDNSLKSALQIFYQEDFIADSLAIEIRNYNGWLFPPPLSGSIAPGQSHTLHFRVGTKGISSGVHNRTIRLVPAAAEVGVVDIPVKLTLMSESPRGVSPVIVGPGAGALLTSSRYRIEKLLIGSACGSQLAAPSYRMRLF